METADRTPGTCTPPSCGVDGSIADVGRSGVAENVKLALRTAGRRSSFLVIVCFTVVTSDADGEDGTIVALTGSSTNSGDLLVAAAVDGIAVISGDNPDPDV